MYSNMSRVVKHESAVYDKCMLKQQAIKATLLKQWPDRVFGVRVAMGWTQGDLADQLNPKVSRQTVANWEAGTHVPKRVYRAQIESIERQAEGE